MLPIKQIRAATDIAALAGRYTKLQRRGNVAVGCCPIHTEKTASFRVNLLGHQYAGLFRCHGCGARGDAVDLMSQVEQIPIAEAARRLMAEAGLSAESEDKEIRAERLREERERPFRLWWFRQRWKEVRDCLDSALAREELDEEFCVSLGRLLRYCERENSSTAGVELFREMCTAADYRRYLVSLRKDRFMIRVVKFLDPAIGVRIFGASKWYSAFVGAFPIGLTCRQSN